VPCPSNAAHSGCGTPIVASGVMDDMTGLAKATVELGPVDPEVDGMATGARGCQAGTKSTVGPSMSRCTFVPLALMIMTGRSLGSAVNERKAICWPSGDHAGPP
jgi:hypothetical protein